MKEVEREDVAQFLHLKELYLDKNDLRYIPGNLLQGNPDLVHICLDDNKIAKIGHNLLLSLQKLTRVGLKSNICINKKVKTRNELPQIIAEIEEKCFEKPAITQTTATTSRSAKTTTTTSPTKPQNPNSTSFH